MGYILEKKVLTDVSNSLRDRGERVVFTHGAFDLFHVGHFELLRRSKKKGDILIVGVDSDERISKYKGNYRPIIRFKDRIKILSALSIIDFILPMDWEFTGSDLEFPRLYKGLNPSVITFGRSWGGKDHVDRDKKALKNISFKQIFHTYSNVETSTTKIIQNILDKGDVLIK